MRKKGSNDSRRNCRAHCRGIERHGTKYITVKFDSRGES